ncbi:MAG TPA: hypothetical protein VN706_24275 [Gemmatimonadaceae bacterium]|nr:hypothetical protein [Gemmatimonadaceae bacterium]
MQRPIFSRGISIAAAILIGIATLDSMGCRTGCDAILIRDFSPVDTTIRVGQSFRPTVHLSTCGGTETINEALRYAVDDATVVQVDSLSGTMTGKSVGHTVATVAAASNGSVVAQIRITVQ